MDGALLNKSKTKKGWTSLSVWVASLHDFGFVLKNQINAISYIVKLKSWTSMSVVCDAREYVTAGNEINTAYLSLFINWKLDLNESLSRSSKKKKKKFINLAFATMVLPSSLHNISHLVWVTLDRANSVLWLAQFLFFLEGHNLMDIGNGIKLMQIRMWDSVKYQNTNKFSYQLI